MIVINDAIVWETIDDDSVCLYNPNNGLLFYLNSTSRFFLDKIIKGLSVREIAQQYVLKNEFEMDLCILEEVEADFEELKMKMINNGILLKNGKELTDN